MWTIHKTKNWKDLCQYTWIQDMHGIPQSPVHHAEGDVAIHTQMVLRALENLPEYQLLNSQQQEIVWASALLHDVEKRSTTYTDEHGNIVSPGHAVKGAQTTRGILYREIETPFAIREHIVALVRYHGLPLWLFEKSNPQKALLKASLELEMPLLVMLARADVLGRICQDQQELLYRIDLFTEFCKEQGCWEQAFQFPSDLSRFSYFRKDEQSPDYVPFDDTQSAVIILSGIAGSGKDHYIKTQCPGWPVISLDDMRREKGIKYNDSQGNGQVIQAAKEKAKQYLRKGERFVWNATNITLQMREQLIDLMAVYKPRITIVYIEVPYKLLLSQNKQREFMIPEAAIERMVDKLEVPRVWEAHELKWEIR
jgi:predicted kinase